MKTLVLATRNPDKVVEIKKILDGFNLLSLEDFPGAPRVRETEKTLEGNALLKARAIAAYTGRAALADDSGLEVRALGGRPGVFSARFAGDKASYADNNRMLLGLLEQTEDRSARFRCVIAVCKPSGEEVTREGVCSGTIARAPRGGAGFGYDPVFVVEGLGQTFAEISPEKKNDLSHRKIALEKIKQYLQENF